MDVSGFAIPLKIGRCPGPPLKSPPAIMASTLARSDRMPHPFLNFEAPHTGWSASRVVLLAIIPDAMHSRARGTDQATLRTLGSTSAMTLGALDITESEPLFHMC